MKKPKLSLRRETVRELSPAAAAQIQGGGHVYFTDHPPSATGALPAPMPIDPFPGDPMF